MRIAPLIAAFTLIAATASVHRAAAQTGPTPPAGQQPPAASEAPIVAPRADTLLKQMADYIGSAQQFTFHADISFDHVLPSGQKLQYMASEDVALKRPDGLYVEWSGDLGQRQFWYDGKSVALYDPGTGFYGSDSAPANMDSMLDKVEAVLGFSPPLVDLMYTDPYRAVGTDLRVRSVSRHVPGERTRVPFARLRRERHRLADLDRYGAPAHAVQAGDYLQDGAVAAAIHRRVQRLEFLAAHCGFGIYAGSPAVRRKDSIRAGRCQHRFPLNRQESRTMSSRTRPGSIFVAGGLIAIGLVLAAEPGLAFRGGFGGFHGGFAGGGGRFGGWHGNAAGGGFHGFSGGSRFGNGGFYDHSGDAGFGRGGWGSVHNASIFSDRASSYDQSHPEYQHNATQFQQNRTATENTQQQNRFNEANTLQQNRTNEVNSVQQNRVNTANNLQYNHQSYYNNWGGWGGYYSGAGFGAGLALGATIAALPAAAAAISVAGNPYYYAGGVYYAPAASDQYQVVPPPQGAVVSTPPPSCSSVYSGSTPYLDCGGAYYQTVASGYQVIPPPIGTTVTTLPSGAVDQNINGKTYFAFGGAYYQPFYSGSSVIYMVVAKPA